MDLRTRLLQMILVRPIIAICLLGLLSACGATGAVVEGTITRAGEPLSGAVLSLSASIAEGNQSTDTETPTAAPTEFSTVTDEQGRYRFEGVAPGTKIATLDLEVVGRSCIAMQIVEVSPGARITRNFDVPAYSSNYSPMLPDGSIVACEK